MIKEKPLFLKNPDWYEYDFKNGKYVLTENAPLEAKKSYEQFYEDLVDVTTNPVPMDERNENDNFDDNQIKGEELSDEEVQEAKKLYNL